MLHNAYNFLEFNVISTSVVNKLTLFHPFIKKIKNKMGLSFYFQDSILSIVGSHYLF